MSKKILKGVCIGFGVILSAAAFCIIVYGVAGSIIRGVESVEGGYKVDRLIGPTQFCEKCEDFVDSELWTIKYRCDRCVRWYDHEHADRKNDGN